VEGISRGWLSELGRRIKGFRTRGRSLEICISTSSLGRIIYYARLILYRIINGHILILAFVSLGTA
jgi:hypothetical protein